MNNAELLEKAAITMEHVAKNAAHRGLPAPLILAEAARETQKRLVQKEDDGLPEVALRAGWQAHKIEEGQAVFISPVALGLQGRTMTLTGNDDLTIVDATFGVGERVSKADAADLAGLEISEIEEICGDREEVWIHWVTAKRTIPRRRPVEYAEKDDLFAVLSD